MTTMAAGTVEKSAKSGAIKSKQAQSGQEVSGAQAGTISEERIARRAYEIWERKGRIDGQCEQNWAEAEAELKGSR